MRSKNQNSHRRDVSSRRRCRISNRTLTSARRLLQSHRASVVSRIPDAMQPMVHGPPGTDLSTTWGDAKLCGQCGQCGRRIYTGRGGVAVLNDRVVDYVILQWSANWPLSPGVKARHFRRGGRASLPRATTLAARGQCGRRIYAGRVILQWSANWPSRISKWNSFRCFFVLFMFLWIYITDSLRWNITQICSVFVFYTVCFHMVFDRPTFQHYCYCLSVCLLLLLHIKCFDC